MWWTQEDVNTAKQWLLRWSPGLLLLVVILLVGFLFGYSFKGEEIIKDCKYAQAFRVGLDSFNCSRKI